MFFGDSLQLRFVLGMWLIVGFIFPFGDILYNIHYLLIQWQTHPDLTIASLVAFMFVTTLIMVLLFVDVRLTNTTEELTEYKLRLEHLVEERTRELHQTVASLEVLALTDPLTKVANRRALKDNLKDEFTRAHRMSQEFSIILFDIDHFKAVNDTYGHEAGDKVLVAIADAAKAAIRDIDMIGRYGGEEFLVVLPGTELAAALEIAARIKDLVSTVNVQDIHCTASFGVANNVGLTNVAEMIEIADEALYAAKDTGRDTICTAKPKDFSCDKCSKTYSCVVKDSDFIPHNCKNL